MFGGFKPSWLYEPLPFLYLGIGLASIAALPNALGILSGLLLALAGALIWAMRRNNRAGFSPSAETIYGERELERYGARRIFTR